MVRIYCGWCEADQTLPPLDVEISRHGDRLLALTRMPCCGRNYAVEVTDDQAFQIRNARLGAALAVDALVADFACRLHETDLLAAYVTEGHTDG